MTEMVSVIKFCGEKFLSQKFNLNRINDKPSNVQYNITIQLSTIDNIFYDKYICTCICTHKKARLQ